MDDTATVDSAATWAAFQEGRASWGDWVEARLHERFEEERTFGTNVLGEVIARLTDDLRDEFNKAIAGLRAQRSLEVAGTYNPSVRYRALDVVALNGGSFAARVDDPGPCPGSDWQLLASRGSRGDHGPKGERGLTGPKGERGQAAASVAVPIHHVGTGLPGLILASGGLLGG